MELQKFKDYLILKDLDKNTIKHYVYTVKKFLEKVPNLNQETVNQYFIKRQEEVAEQTFNSDRNALSHYIRFKNLDIELPKNKKIPKKIKSIVTAEYFKKQILPMIDFIFTNPLKVKTILIFLFCTGLRRSEMANLKRSDINIKDRIVKIRDPKNHKDRIVPYPTRVNKYLDMYFSAEAEESSAFNISSQGIYDIFATMRPYFKEIENLSPHTFRHSFATYSMNNGMPIFTLKEILGHEDIKTTEQYVTINLEDLKREVRDKLKNII